MNKETIHLAQNTAVQHAKALAEGTLAKLVEQAALTYARLASNQDGTAFTPLGSMQRLPKRMELGLAANDDRRDDLGGRGNHARNLTLNTERLSNEIHLCCRIQMPVGTWLPSKQK